MKLLRSSKAISKKVSLKILVLHRSQGVFYRKSLLEIIKLILIFNFINFIPLVSNRFNIRKMKYCIENKYQFYPQIL